MFRSSILVLALLIVGCENAGGGSPATLYRNSPIDRLLRVHFASFDAPESGDFNLTNCEMVARILNANVDVSAQADGKARDPGVGFWCEAGLFTETGATPSSFESEFPSDVRSPVRW